MSKKLLVSAACLSLTRIMHPQICNFRCASSPFLSNSLPYSANRGIISFGHGKFYSSYNSTDGRSLESSTVVPKSVPIQVAHELLQAGHRYLDVRTPEEFKAGHVVGAINVPFLFRDGSGAETTNNPKFLEGVSSHFTKEDDIIIGCQSGKRSLLAAADLISTGYTGVKDVAGGYDAWKQSGLPIES